MAAGGPPPDFDDRPIAAPRSSRERQASTVAAQASKRAPSFARTTAQTAASSNISSKAAAWSAGTQGLALVSASKAALSASTSLMKCSSGSTRHRALRRRQPDVAPGQAIQRELPGDASS